MDLSFLSEQRVTVNTVERECGDCSACCEGHLTSVILGYEMGPNKPCKFLLNGCSIYPQRPDDPCKGFKCLWKVNHTVPNHFKPNLSKVIITSRWIGDMPYTVVVEAGDTLSIEVLDWVLIQFNEGKMDNIVYMYNGKQNQISRNPKWIEAMKSN